jgi:hypothetical protein
MSWLATLPVIGGLFEKVGEALDRNLTTDEERLKAKVDLMSIQAPVLVAVVEAQKAFNEAQEKIRGYEVKSEKFIVYARRPIIDLVMSANCLVVFWFWMLDVVPNANFEIVRYSAMLAGASIGIDFTSRGVEKVVASLKSKEKI